MTVFIGGAWPYANGSLHIGHLSSLLGGDVLARYFRLRGHQVCYVSGSDCHGTPITLRAKKDGVEPGQISSRYHREFADCFQRLGFSYDHFGRTDCDEHKRFVQGFFKSLFDHGQLYEKEAEQAYCIACSQFLPDRFVTGKCPHCGKEARGDQCDACGSLLDPSQLLERTCSICGGSPEFRPARHLFLPLSQFSEALNEFLEEAQGWRLNALGLTRRYLDEGLKDRAATRDIDWGVDVPLEGYSGKKIYVWVEAVLGYLSTCLQVCREKEKDFDTFWGDRQENLLHYYIHGKDNIPFHTVILPALLMAHGGLKLPDRIISSEYETLEGRKISTSGNWAIWVPDLLERYHPDSIRYFFVANGPERKDSDFSWTEFYNCHNADLVGQFGNLVNRCLVFVHKSHGGKVPAGTLEESVTSEIEKAFASCGSAIEQGAFREALASAFALVRFGNKYFDERKPWITVRENPTACSTALFNCFQIIASLSVLLEPFIPFSCKELREMLHLEPQGWLPVPLPEGRTLKEPRILFARLDKKGAELELEKLFGAKASAG